MSAPPFRLTILGRNAVWDGALAVVLGYTGGTRKLMITTPSQPDGHVVEVPAFPQGVYDCTAAWDDDGWMTCGLRSGMWRSPTPARHTAAAVDVGRFAEVG